MSAADLVAAMLAKVGVPLRLTAKLARSRASPRTFNLNSGGVEKWIRSRVSANWRRRFRQAPAGAVYLVGVIGLATNTMHICAPQIVAGLGVPFVHIAAPTADALLAAMS